MFEVDPSAGDLVGFLSKAKLRAPYGVLVQLLGPPLDDPPEKCSTCWALREIGARDNEVLLKDWQDEDDRSFNLNVFRGLPSYDWDVWASSDEVATRFCRWLSARVIAKVSEVKTLSPERRAELNALLAKGVPIAEAMKRVPPESAKDAAARFAWPIRD